MESFFEQFRNPPDEYGIVPFYWWVGEKLTKERLLWQLNRLSDMDFCGLQINYCHRDTGGYTYGLPYVSDPPQFTEEWWKLVEWFVAQAKERGMSVSLSDYTLGTAGQGYFMDEILSANPDICGAQLCAELIVLKKGETLDFRQTDDTVGIYAYEKGKRYSPFASGDGNGKSASYPLAVNVGWECDADECTVAVVRAKRNPRSLDPMNPLSGSEMIRCFFAKFEQRFPGECGKALNFFFSDELNFGVSGNLYNAQFPSAFTDMKGYDVRPFLAALFIDIGPFTQKLRLDYADVTVTLQERNYFQPVYDWHEARGMTYGCDHGGRGKDVTEFGDYFRTQKYNQGPGNDQPALASDIIKNKVSSSIAHVYGRPRTWLEGFYGSGWGTSSADLFDAVCRNFAMGSNLLSYHGLYYTTLGGYWEWAPPCNGFRTPYYDATKGLNRAVKRLSYIGTRGTHVCDAAIVYPVAAVQGGLCGGDAVAAAFGCGEFFYRSAVDFDFIDFTSVAHSTVVTYGEAGEKHGHANCGSEKHGADGCRPAALRTTSGKQYRAVILPDMLTVRYEMLQKLKSFADAGGLVLCLGRVPIASDNAGRDDCALSRTVAELFPVSRRVDSPADCLRVLDAHFPRDFSLPVNTKKPPARHGDSLDGTTSPISAQTEQKSVAAYVLHRSAPFAEFYSVYGVRQGTPCYFRAKGVPVLLDPISGDAFLLQADRRRNGASGKQPLGRETEGDACAPLSDFGAGTVLRLPMGEKSPQIIAFFKNGAPDLPRYPRLKQVGRVRLNGAWACTLKPTMNNLFGDFLQPPFDGFVGAQARRYAVLHADGTNVEANRRQTAGFGPYYKVSGALAPDGDDRSLLLQRLLSGDFSQLSDYSVSLRYGAEGDPGHQGWHGLKGCITDDFLCFGKRVDTHHEYRYDEQIVGGVYYAATRLYLAQEQTVRFSHGAMLPDKMWIDGEPLPPERICPAPEECSDSRVCAGIRLSAGTHNIVLLYPHSGRTHFVPLKADGAGKSEPYPLSTKFYRNKSVLPFGIAPQPDALTRLRVVTPPGATEICVPAHGTLTGRAAGKALTFTRAKDGRMCAPLPFCKKPIAVTLCIVTHDGSVGGAALDGYADFVTGEGETALGDWGKTEGLAYYSGGITYRKTFCLDDSPLPCDCKNMRVFFEAKEVCSACEIRLNGKLSATLFAPPWRAELTQAFRDGENVLEVTVYNTLYNHYRTTPSKYNAPKASGLLGGVCLTLYKEIE